MFVFKEVHERKEDEHSYSLNENYCTPALDIILSRYQNRDKLLHS